MGQKSARAGRLARSAQLGPPGPPGPPGPAGTRRHPHRGGTFVPLAHFWAENHATRGFGTKGERMGQKSVTAPPGGKISSVGVGTSPLGAMNTT